MLKVLFPKIIEKIEEDNELFDLHVNQDEDYSLSDID